MGSSDFKPSRSTFTSNTNFGDTITDQHQFTGSMHVTGTLYLNGTPVTASGGGGSGNITGSGVVTDNAIVRWSGTDGTVLQNSGVTIDDNNIITILK